MSEHIYAAIDLKSFYASVECVERGLDPLTTNLVVADASRTEKTICLAVSPSLKARGISGRPRLFEVIQQVGAVNAQRRKRAPGGRLRGGSVSDVELRHNPSLAVDYITATPHMALYVQRSTQIYEIYLRHVSAEDVHVYSIDEVFIDITGYLRTSGMNARSFTMMLVREVLEETGVTATAGIGSNMYLAKVAMDIVAKHAQPDALGMRMAYLDEMGYRRALWTHEPLTDFWRIGAATARKLNQAGMHTMGDIARASVAAPDEFPNEATLYRLFGVNAELLIDHAWGWEPATIADVKAYVPEARSIGQGQVLTEPYEADKARLVVREMADAVSFDLVEKGLVCDQVVLTVGYDRTNLEGARRAAAYEGAIRTDYFGRAIPHHAHGTAHLGGPTSSSSKIIAAIMGLFDEKVDKRLLVRRVNVTACNVLPEHAALPARSRVGEQLDLFCDVEALDRARAEDAARDAREKRMQQAIVEARHKFGKNAVLKGMDLKEGATTVQRNAQIGGHRA